MSVECKEKNKLLWDKYFMGIALLCEKRSKDENTQVGACVVNDELCVVGTGYNGMPLNCRDRLIWGPDGECPQGSTVEKEKHFYVCHAELNAIVNRNPKSVKDCTLYVTLFPCNECAKIIIKSGIRRLVYLSGKPDNPKFQDSRKMLERIEKANKLKIVNYSELVEKSDKGSEKERKMIEKLCFNLSGAEAKQPPISWDHYFMALAIWSGQFLGEDEKTPKRGACVLYGDKVVGEGKVLHKADATTLKEGACIVNEDKRIVGLGFVQNMEADMVNDLNHCVMHAPVNAIVNESPASLNGSTLYAVRYPCCECAKVIVQSGIVKLIYLKDEIRQKENWKKAPDEIKKKKIAAEKMFAIAHIKTEAYDLDEKKMSPLSLDFRPKPPKRKGSPSTAGKSKRAKK